MIHEINVPYTYICMLRGNHLRLTIYYTRIVITILLLVLHCGTNCGAMYYLKKYKEITIVLRKYNNFEIQ